MIADLRTRRLRLRPWQAADREPFARMNADPDVMAYFASPLTRHQSDTIADRIEAQFARMGWGLWAVEIPGVTPFAGFIGLATPRFDAHFTPCTEVGWRLARECWGAGYATEGAAAALEFGFGTLGLAEIVSFTAVENRRSIRVMERLGMTRDSADDFDHPGLPPGHRLRPHVLYRTRRPGRA
jgi:RimJ/RimL family protein N-acetyltransferase